MTIEWSQDTIDSFFWYNEPKYIIENGELAITTKEDTDFWQRTHYGFSRDNGHALLTSLNQDFILTVRTCFDYQNHYDQCGLFIRIDALNWIKVSVEREDNEFSRLGSVVTNLGYSDWATTDIDGRIRGMWYRIISKKNDFIISSSHDGIIWSQMRIAHLHNRQRPLNIGIYACSPEAGSFTAVFSEMTIETDF